MNNNSIIIEQSLHGYSNGHHLISTSKVLSDKSQRTMAILSDLSGPELYDGFIDYITMYPLINDGYYVFAKTWYAAEMNRPGCVWTHSLLIDFEYFLLNFKIEDVFTYFRKPFGEIDKKQYSSPKYLECNRDYSELDKNNEISMKIVKELLIAIFTDSAPVLIPTLSSKEYQKELMFIWNGLYKTCKHNLSICTGSLSNRMLVKNAFDIQLVPIELYRNISRSLGKHNTININPNSLPDERYPKWLSVVINNINGPNKGDLSRFVDIFGNKLTGKEYFGKLAELYLNVKEHDIVIDTKKYIQCARKLFNENDYKQLTENVINYLLKNSEKDWLLLDRTIDFLNQISISENDYYDICDIENKIKAALLLLWEIDQIHLNELFRKLISCKLNNIGESIIKIFSRIITPQELPILTNMEIGACSVLIKLNPDLATNTIIWRQSYDYQIELLDCIKDKNIGYKQKQAIFEAILENSQEVLTDKIYNVFGSDSITILLRWSSACGSNYLQSKEKWLALCKYDSNTCISWIIENKNTVSTWLIINIISILDPYSNDIQKINMQIWVELFNLLNLSEINSDSILNLSIFFLPLILRSNLTVQEDFAKFVFTTIHEKLMRSDLSYSKWIKIETLLPELQWYNSWDKCKRLRKAFKQRGYRFII